MSSLSSDDDFDRRRESYSPNADVSESESSSNAFSYDSPASPPPLGGAESDANSDISAPPPIMLPVVRGRHVVVPAEKLEMAEGLSEIALMKRFAKLLLGEDMSGRGKGVCPALAISNAITNLSATVFGELRKLEPLKPEMKSMWLQEMEWLLCVSDSIVELTSAFQESLEGGVVEVMVSRQRNDLYVYLPALKKLDAMLMNMLDSFRDSEFSYVDRGVLFDGCEQIEDRPSSSSSERQSTRPEEKWWQPFPKVPAKGLSKNSLEMLIQFRDNTIQIFKAAVAINDSVLSQMEIPNVYLESLPKSAKTCLGESIYDYLTADKFSPKSILDLKISSEYNALEVANSIEAAVHIWRHKYSKGQLQRSKSGRSSWGGTVKGLIGDTGKCKLFADRAEILLQNLKLEFPGLPQSDLDINKIQYNKDVGQSILESYSRVMESLAFNLLAMINELIYVDDATKQRAAAECTYAKKQFTE